MWVHLPNKKKRIEAENLVYKYSMKQFKMLETIKFDKKYIKIKKVYQLVSIGLSVAGSDHQKRLRFKGVLFRKLFSSTSSSQTNEKTLLLLVNSLVVGINWDTRKKRKQRTLDQVAN